MFRLAPSPDGSHLAYLARGEEGLTVGLDEEISGPFDAVGVLEFSPDGSHLAVATREGKRWTVYVDGTPAGEHDEIPSDIETFFSGSDDLQYFAVNG